MLQEEFPQISNCQHARAAADGLGAGMSQAAGVSRVGRAVGGDYTKQHEGLRKGVQAVDVRASDGADVYILKQQWIATVYNVYKRNGSHNMPRALLSPSREIGVDFPMSSHFQSSLLLLSPRHRSSQLFKSSLSQGLRHDTSSVPTLISLLWHPPVCLGLSARAPRSRVLCFPRVISALASRLIPTPLTCLTLGRSVEMYIRANFSRLFLLHRAL